MKNGIKNTKAMMLIAVPARPRDQRAAGSASPRRRLERMHPIESTYEARSAEIVRETIALRATAEPRLIKLIMIPQRKETKTALSGIGKSGETCKVSAT